MVRTSIQRSAIALFLAVAVLGTVAAQEGYEGLVTIGRFGRFPSGTFGASNLVPPNTLVLVRNLETGRSERVIITDSVTEPGVFLVLSPEAAESLEIDPGGATRVRLTEISTGGVAAVDPASERALSQDPDMNPLAGISLLDTLPPAQPPEGESRDESVGDPSVAAEVEPAPPLLDALAQAEPEVAVKPEPVKPAPEKPEPAPKPEPEREPASDPVESQPRTGIAAGIARTTVGQAQQEFERPDTTFPVERPDPVPVPAPEQPGEPTVAPEETGSTGLATSPPRPPESPAIPDDRIVEPAFPSVEPSNGALARDDESLDVATFEPEPEERSVEEQSGPLAIEGPIDAALQSVVNRLPRKDLYPSPVGEEGEIGFRRADQPAQAVAVARLPEVEVPAVERPSLAGLAPLQAVSEDLDVELAVAEVPEDERPDFAGLAVRPEPETEVMTAQLPEAEAATPAVAEPSGPARVSPGEEEIARDLLAEAVPEADERPEVAGRPSVTPTDRELEADLVEARVGPEELPEGSLAGITPDETRPASDGLADGRIPEPVEETAEVAEAAEEPLDRPEGIAEDAILALEPADFRPPETPEPDTESIIAREDVEPEEDPEGDLLADPGVVEEEPVVVAGSEPEPAPEPEPIDRGSLPVIGALEAERYYLQIGAYSEASTAQVAVDALGATYPMAVIPAGGADRTIYRVLVGPLERDETGTLLLWLRARGYRDTFVREGSEL